jgi:Icc-related predicted phosphoesterase
VTHTNPLYFVSDLHGDKDRFKKLIGLVRQDVPPALFIGGDITPHFARYTSRENFFADFLLPEFRRLKEEMKNYFPAIFIIMGNDDLRIEEEYLFQGEDEGLWQYIHNRKTFFGNYPVYGYACVPPTPFRLKDWERYDVSRYIDPGCVPPTEGIRSVDAVKDIEYCTIQKDLAALTSEDDLSRAIILFHSPPYQTNLDRVALDEMKSDHVPLDVHVGSIAIKRFIEDRQPMITLHGHVHESARITGYWSQKIGKSYAFNAATDQKGLSIIKIPLDHPAVAERIITGGR